MLDFSKDCYYGKIYSRAQRVLTMGLLLAGASAVSLPIFVNNSTGLALTYFGCVLVAICGYKWGISRALIVGAVVGIADTGLLYIYLGEGAVLQQSLLLTTISYVALSIGFAGIGKVARDHQQIKFSDQLPRVADRDYLLAVLEKELARTKRRRNSIFLAIVELRILEKVEKEHGHHQTDLLSRQLQAALMRQLRSNDTLAVLDGPFLAILLCNTDREGAETALNRLRESTRHLPVRSFHRLAANVSDWRIAVIELDRDDTDPLTMLHRAAARLGPLVPQRAGLISREFEAAI